MEEGKSITWPVIPFELIYLEPSRNGIYKSKEFHGEGLKIVNMGELFAYDTISNQDMNRVKLNESEILRFILNNGDLLFGRRSLVESGAGKCSIVEKLLEPTTFESSIIRVRINQIHNNPRFYYYWFRSPKGRSVIKAIVTGTNVKGITGNNLKKIVIDNPKIEIQNKITSILIQYDDLIENNRRRIQLLEEAARLLYQEWFIRLRFPGHEHTEIVDGVPVGWHVKTAYEIMDVCSGGTPKTGNPEYWDGEIPFFTPKDVKDQIYSLKTEKNITDSGLKNCNSKLYPKDTIFITARGTVGKICLAQTGMAMNQSCYALISKPPLNQYFLLFALREGISQIQSRAVGAVFDAIIVDTFKMIPFTVPSEHLIELFSEHISPHIQQIDNLILQNIKLKEARDLLLPRLMNGVIPV